MEPTPLFEEFVRLTVAHDTVPVFREIAADLDTPVSAFMKLHRKGHGFLLESVEGGERWGRYSVLGSEPLMLVRAHGNRTEVRRRGSDAPETLEGDPLDCLRRVIEPFNQADVEGLERFAGGFVGYFAYDLVRHIEDLPDENIDDLGVAEIAGMVADNFVIFDNVSHTMKVVSLALCGDGADPRVAYDRAVVAINHTVERLQAAAPAPAFAYARAAASSSGESSTTAAVERTCNITPNAYAVAVERAREYIRAGDVIQVVLSQRFSQPLGVHPFSIYRGLRTINPSPYMFYLDLGDEVAVGASPEVMAKVEGRTVAVRPIAGTVRRGATEEETSKLIEQMLADPKERAEHIMLLDLGRNDVGRVSAIGSVRVIDQMVAERYSHVCHIVSHVEGTLRDDCDRFDAFRATFPAGTLSGAPKIRAMQIIDELETTRRGVYGGAVGYFDFKGNMDTCIAIRTVFIKNDTVYLQAGAGIVADSVAEREQAECEAKAAGVQAALERAVEIEAASAGGRKP